MKTIQITPVQRAQDPSTSWVRSLATGIIVAASIATAAASHAEAGPPPSARSASSAPAQPALLAQAGASKASPAGDLDALVKAAKAEGDFLYYIDLTENVAKRVGDAFAAKYGIKTTFVRLAGVPLQQRYATEAEANNIPANLLITSNSLAFAIDGTKRGWLEPISEAGLPVVRSGEFPSRLVLGPAATIQATPWLITYNTDKLKGDAIPKDWTDVLKPALRGQVLLPDPRVANAYIDFWSLIYDKHGPAFFEQLRAQNPRQYSSGVPAVQALAAGEGSILFPAVTGQVAGARDKGGPVNTSVISHTTGVEAMIMLTARAKARQPNGARLFANYVMSQEGNKVLNDDPGGTTVYDLSKLPRQYESPKPWTPARKDEIVKLLGFQ